MSWPDRAFGASAEWGWAQHLMRRVRLSPTAVPTATHGDTAHSHTTIVICPDCALRQLGPVP